MALSFNNFFWLFAETDQFLEIISFAERKRNWSFCQRDQKSSGLDEDSEMRGPGFNPCILDGMWAKQTMTLKKEIKVVE